MLLNYTIKLRSLFAAFLMMAVFFACNEKPDTGTDNNTPPEPLPDLTVKVTAAAVSGFITNENDAAVQSATVEIGGTTVTTDKYGYFEVRNALVVQNAATVTVSKTGYFKTVKTFIAAAGKSAFFRIKLLPKTIAGSFTATAGGTITLASGMAISIPAAGVVNAATNAAYTGTVSMAAQLISAVNPDLNRLMPGDLRGLNTNGNLRVLTTYGMMAVELTGAGGEPLQIASGKKATITLPIPAALQAGAPATIPLWYFDETKGLWKEEGTATKSGSNYTGEVTHFSFWNYDVPASYVQFNCTVVNQAGQPLPNVLVKVSALSNPSSFGIGYTDSTGYTGGAVPNNAQLKLEVFTNSSCNTPSHSQTFTTTTSNISLGNITVNTATALAAVSGTVTSCSNAPVTNGYIIVTAANNNYRFPVTNGTFSFNLMLCSGATTASIIAEDITNQQQNTGTAFTINPGNNAIGNIQACGLTTQQFLNYTINGTPYSFTSPADTFFYSAFNTSIYLSGQKTTVYSRGVINITSTGIAAGSSQPLLSFIPSQVIDTLSIVTPVNVSITEFGTVGQFIAGNFTGTFKGNPPANTNYNVACSFRFRRKN
jgi:hypothetical protein